MGDLTGQRIDQTYEGLIKTEDEQHLEAAEKRLTDGIGNNLPVTVGALGMSYYGTQDFTNATVIGAVGEKGQKGDTGADGAAGAAGAKGDKGDTGLTGTTGAKGDKGDTGADSTVPGPTGPQGEKGAIGVTGPQGDKGDKGAIGPSGGEKGEKGDTGAEGPQGVKGEKGDKGDIGTTGPIGPTGPTGGTGLASIRIPVSTVSGAVTNHVLANTVIPANTFTTARAILLLTGFLEANYGSTPSQYQFRIYIGSSPAYDPVTNYAIGWQPVSVAASSRVSIAIRKNISIFEYFDASQESFEFIVGENYATTRSTVTPDVSEYDSEGFQRVFTGTIDWNVDNYLQIIVDGGAVNDSFKVPGLTLSMLG